MQMESILICNYFCAALLLGADLPWSGAQQCLGGLGDLWLPSVRPQLWAAQRSNCHCHTGGREGESSRKVSQAAALLLRDGWDVSLRLQLLFENCIMQFQLQWHVCVCVCGVCVCVFSSIKRSNCYMVWAGESSSPGQGRNNNGLEIGCLVDTTHGLLTFTANGKELSTYYQVNTWCGVNRFFNEFPSIHMLFFIPTVLLLLSAPKIHLLSSFILAPLFFFINQVVVM